MAHITLTFDATEEKQEALDAINVHEYKAKIDEALEFIRRIKKYDEKVSKETILALEEVGDILEKGI